MNYQIRGLSIHVEVHGTAEPALVFLRYGGGRTWRKVVWATSVLLSAIGLQLDPHRSVKQIHHEELEDGDQERPSAFPQILLKQTDSGIQQLDGAGKRTQDQQRRRRLLVDRPQCEQSQRNCARRRVQCQYQRRLRWNVSRRDQVLRADDPRDRKAARD
jgi:hypothetical protein